MEITLLSPKVWDKIQTAAEFYPYESHISKILMDYVNKVKPKFYDVKIHNEKTIFFSMLKVSFFRIPNREKKHLFPNILAVILEKDGYYVYEELDEKKA